MNINGVFAKIDDVAKGLIGLGMSLIALALVADLLQPGFTGIVSKVSGVVGSFTSGGLIGLITLIVFVVVFSKD